MDSPVTGNRHQSLSRNRTMEKRDDTSLHIAVRAGDVDSVMEILSSTGEQELKELLSKTNQSGETALYVAAEYGCVDFVREMMKYYDLEAAGIKAKNGFDAFHIAAKQGDLEILKVLMESQSELSMTFDQTNTTAVHTACEQGHIEVVKFLLEKNSSMATIAKSNHKTALHSCARKGHLDVMKALLEKVPEIATRADKKGQTALHMAAKGQSVDIVNELIAADDGLINMVDKKENTALHIATRKGRLEIVLALLSHKETIQKDAINKSGETALDTAEKFTRPDIATVLREHGVVNAKSLKKPPPMNPAARELKQTVSDIKHEVHDQLEHTLKTHKRVKGIGKRINRMHHESLNNAINSTTVVAVLIATVTFAAIYQLPGQYADGSSEPPQPPPVDKTLGEANISGNPEFIVFLIFDSLALFISLAVVVVQTSIVVVERRAKKQVMAVINKLMWLACVFVSVAFLALSFVVVGNERWLAVGVAVIGSVTLASTLGTMCYWVIMHRIEANNLRSIRRSARSSKSLSGSVSIHSDSENDDFKKLYAI
ncbi:putative ankyrin repeat-containing protein [Helianthus annuus]|uniref:Ankyrin repeat-containing protein n=1 Tax=Helianthus annuus TaxID=4232 RepID=A0A251SRF2_HELAN|nr:ankyrin repeat-containing protein At5g02620 [Helianthus annuus]KAF5773008.1 putative ankyrin repeat-containing protein [Helianthus annuus]KAJ0497378.1 putative ankyrin repeat-containing domain, PGG domain, ankyrin repeat-containing domain superfamily [Helianthus annuus]KAJ0663392.1 putative ankyrin repeat-containing domain, PGG domain, ankyrin repeat-containing domain superfamily [Helianthus annuus]KAJ0848826.1 putative ankyrin repeat-containing protein [Helianthus annuus]